MLPCFRITTALCYAIADVDTAPTSRFAALNDSRTTQAEACRADRWIAAQVRDLPSLRADVLLAGGTVPVADLAPKRATQSRAERREATRMVDKLRVRTVKPSRAAQKAVKAQRARRDAIAAGTASVAPTNALENLCRPVRSSALLWEHASRWENPNAGLAFICASR